MRMNKLEKEDTTKSLRTPNNLLEYLRCQPSPNEEFFFLLGKHYNSLRLLLNGKLDYLDNQEIKNALFIIELNEFSDDLEGISKICMELDLEIKKHHENLKKISEELRNYKSEQIAREIDALYIEARNYDEYFVMRQWMPKIGRTSFLWLHFSFPRPFSHNPKLSNEENIFNLIASFRIHDNFFKNYLNVLYADGEDGEDFLGKSFEAVSADYKKISEIILEMARFIPEAETEKKIACINAKNISLDEIMKKHPAILFSATKKILLYLENTAKASLN